ncbi:MAG: 3'(2'),5'-bisphosphate nucleotidase CysQ [Crocinitomicaceae bacterium]|nr:3'(2'),5'-bisphosphate nucleotidase CysQ [Crocinitomicaceae bacterium]
MVNIPEIYTIAIKASIEAASVIMEVYKQDVDTTIKSDGSPVTIADLAASKIIARHLKQTGIPIIGEEIEKEQFSKRTFWTENWCVDPLDGTKMFLLKNDEFSVNIAHVVNEEPVFGIICSPTEKIILIGGPKYGVYTLNFEDIETPEVWKRIQPKSQLNDPLIITCSRNFFHDQETILKEHLNLEPYELSYLRKGSALKFFDLALGRADVYPRFAPTMEWDIAAGQAIMEALGGTVISTLDTKKLRYNKESLFNPYFIAKTKAFLS